MSFFSTRPINMLDETRTINGIAIYALADLLKESAATQEFKDAVTTFFNDKKQNDFIKHSSGIPAVKIIRVIMKLLQEYPETKIESIRVDAQSGCSNFDGMLAVEPENLTIHFSWDCAWRAKQSNVVNQWGMVDQAKAAWDFGYQCFSTFEPVASEKI